ncbi:TPA: tyrosine-type recombinase/integrase [Vibrio parahaemolyticus]|nr:tyrosine-type recombinase/integrase [Vibrio parahaemolyticus]
MNTIKNKKHTKNEKRREALKNHDFANTLLKAYDRRNDAKSTTKADESRVLAILEFGVKQGYKTFNAELVDDFRDHLIKVRKLNPKTVNNYNTVIRFLSLQAVRYVIANTDVSAGIKNFSYKPTNKRSALSLQECKKVIKAAQKLCQASAIGFELHYRLGLRVSELIALSWSDISLKRQTITIRRANVVGEFKQVKTEAGARIIELNREECQLLQSLYCLTGHFKPLDIQVTQDDNYSVVTETVQPILYHLERKSHYISVKKYQQWFCEDAFKLAKVNFNGRGTNIPRHTFASHTRSSGIPDTLIAEQMGHSKGSKELLDLFYSSNVNDTVDIRTERAKCFSNLVENTPDPIKFEYKQSTETASITYTLSGLAISQGGK